MRTAAAHATHPPRNAPCDTRLPSCRSPIWRNAGIGGFWRGWQPNVARCFIVNAAELGCYDQAKMSLVRSGLVSDGPVAHVGASWVAGITSAFVSTPVDVVKTRLMAQAGGAATAGIATYDGVLDCFLRMPRAEGLASLYKGFVPNAARKVLWATTYFSLYEKLLKLARSNRH